LRKEVDELLQWRRDTLRQEIQSMQATRAEMDSLRAKLSQVQTQMEAVKSLSLDQKASTVTDRQLNDPALGGGTFG
jgi:prefoldin subunit 5